MTETFLYAMRAVLPILLMIAVGYWVRRVGPWDGKFFKALNKLGFRVFMPLNIFCNIYTVEDLSAINWTLAGYALLAVVAFMAVGMVFARLLPRRDQRGVLVQAGFRSNMAILGLPLAQTLGGTEAMVFASLLTGVVVPTFSVLSVLVLVFYSGNREKRPPARDLVLQIVKNPLILGSAAGILAVALRQFGVFPAWFLRDSLPSVYKVISDLAKITSPIMLFVLGTTLDFKATGHLLPQIGLGMFLRLILAPALGIGAALVLRNPLGLTSVEIPALVAAFASPVAVSSAVMVQEIGGDDQLASQLVVWSSVASMATIFAIVFLLRTMGVL